MDDKQLRALIRTDESRHVELKERWYEDSLEGKAKLAKDVLALANSVGPGEYAYLIIGVEDHKRGGGIIGVETPLSPEAVSQILADYTTPPPIASLRHVTLDGKRVSVLTIEGSLSRPHHAVRQFSGVLEPSLVYIRRDRTNGTATSREVEGMLLERIGRRGAGLDPVPLRAGFVGHDSYPDRRSLLVRVTNVVDRIVAGIDVLMDLEHIIMPEIKARQALLRNLSLAPGASREVEFSTTRLSFFHRHLDRERAGQINITSIQNLGHHVGDGWMTARLRVYFRDDEGFLQEIIREVALDM